MKTFTARPVTDRELFDEEGEAFLEDFEVRDACVGHVLYEIMSYLEIAATVRDECLPCALQRHLSKSAQHHCPRKLSH